LTLLLSLLLPWLLLLRCLLLVLRVVEVVVGDVLLLLRLRFALLLRAAVIQQVTHQPVLSDMQVPGPCPLLHLRSIRCCCCTSHLAPGSTAGPSCCCLRRRCRTLLATTPAAALPASGTLLLGRLSIPGVCDVICICCRRLRSVAAALATLLLGPGCWQVEGDAVVT
jgi:hypothetical protein